jgi:hypothetical protein
MAGSNTNSFFDDELPDWYEREYVSFCFKIKVKGNEALLAEFKTLSAQHKLTSELIKAFKKRNAPGQLYLDL